MINNYDITDRFGPINSDYTYKFMGISNSSLEKLKKDTNVEWIKKDTFPKGFKDPSVFPQKSSFNWNNDFYGPIYIPKKDSSVELNKENLPIYERLLGFMRIMIYLLWMIKFILMELKQKNIHLSRIIIG